LRLPVKLATSSDFGRIKKEVNGSQYPQSMGEKQNQLDQRGNTFWGPIELVRKPYSVVDSSSTDFFRHFH